MNGLASEELFVVHGPPPPWRRALSALLGSGAPFRAPRPEPRELYVHYEGDRDPWGNVRFALYWYDPWAVVTRKGATAGTARCRFHFCDDSMLYRHWLLEYERVIDWPSGADITDSIRERL